MISRRALIGGLAGAALWPFGTGPARAAADPDVLYNGIQLGRPWPPRRRYTDDHPVLPPYLAQPPAVIPIDVGRQLFVDDFLIADTNLARSFHRATYHPANPVLRPDRPWEMGGAMGGAPGTPSAMVFSDGVFWDPARRQFLMWYMGGYGTSTCLAVSDDGVAWYKPDLDVVPHTNIVHPRQRDSGTVWRDPFERDPRRRFKMAQYFDHSLVLWASPDGVHWAALGETGPCGDRSTFFYNPFRRVWVFSLRANASRNSSVSGRFREYWEDAAFEHAAGWSQRPAVPWVKADSLDTRRSPQAELYNLDAVAYESVMLGLFSMWRGEASDREKINEVELGFSRDGFHWHRPSRDAFLPVSDTVGDWNWANVQSAGGGCVIVGDQLHFYVSGRQGKPGTDAPGVCTTGLATLRRDGFASMDWLPDTPGTVRRREGVSGGFLTTRPITFTGGHLFVNADARGGELRVEVLDEQGQALSHLTADGCAPITVDGTRLPVRWASGALAALAGRVVRFRFTITRGRLFAFWVSPSQRGESRGYPAAGGPEFSALVDDGGA